MLRKLRQKNRVIFTFLMVSVTINGILLFFKQNSFASWREGETGIQYEDEKGELTTGFCKIDEKLYYFDKASLMLNSDILKNVLVTFDNKKNNVFFNKLGVKCNSTFDTMIASYL